MTAPFTGGCACGGVRYEVAAEPAFAVNCHCKDCQRATGGQMATLAAVPKSAFRLTQGTPKAYSYIGDSGKPLQRHFCQNCGSRLFTDAEALPDMLLVTAGSMDDASWLKPKMHIYASSAQPWATIPADATVFPKMPA